MKQMTCLNGNLDIFNAEREREERKKKVTSYKNWHMFTYECRIYKWM